MADTRVAQRFLLLLVLLCFYCAGPIVVFLMALYSLWWSPGLEIENETLVRVVGEVASNPGAYTNIIHQMIMPVVAVITAANYASLTFSGLVAWMFIIPLVTIFVCIVDALLFNVFVSSSDAAVMGQFFISMAGNLAVYVMLFVGLQLGQTPADS